jgi:acyl-CoA thioester hydrolase
MLEEYPLVIDIAVQWGDMDCLGHVNNIVYLQYFEAARIEYLMRLGLDPPGPKWRDSGLIVASLSCDYKVPVVYPDTVSVGARTAAIGENRVLMEHAAVSQKLGKVAAEGEVILVSYNYMTLRSVALRSDWRDAIVALEGRELPVLPPHARLSCVVK